MLIAVSVVIRKREQYTDGLNNSISLCLGMSTLDAVERFWSHVHHSIFVQLSLYYQTQKQSWSNLYTLLVTSKDPNLDVSLYNKKNGVCDH